MKGELVSTLTSDGLELEGFFTERPSATDRGVVLFIHGMYENFYLPRFLPHLAERLGGIGYRLLTVNTRAHDYLIHCRRWNRSGQFEWSPAGGSREIFRESLIDINGWIEFLRGRNVERIILAGHSHGALKVALYASSFPADDSVAALVLVSPSDDVGIQEAALGDRFAHYLKVARGLVESGQGEELMPADAYGNEITAETYLDIFAEPSDVSIFRMSRHADGLKRLKAIRNPTYVIYGESDKATGAASSREALGLIQAAMPHVPAFSGEIVPGGDHSYCGVEAELAGSISAWIERTTFSGTD